MDASFKRSCGFEILRLPCMMHPVDSATAVDGLGGSIAAVAIYRQFVHYHLTTS